MKPHTPNPSDTDDVAAVEPPSANDEAQVPFDNPYAQQHASPPPDLERNVPRMTQTEVRDMNRKALGLLAAIVLLLAVAGIWLLRSGSTSDKTAARRDESVSVPESPLQPGASEKAPPATGSHEQPASTRDGFPIPLVPETRSRRAGAIDERAPSRDRDGSPQTDAPAPRPQGPTLVERRIAAAQAGSALGTGDAGPAAPPAFQMPNLPVVAAASSGDLSEIPPNVAYKAKPLADVSSAASLTHPDTLMMRGTYIRCVLETRIVTDQPGFTSCVVTEPVYSFSGKRMLLPKGSKVLGKYEMEPNGPRVAVIWDRIVTPTGIDVNMASPGADTLGGAGHPGHYAAHWGSRIGAAMLISLMSDAFKYAAAEHGPRQTTITNGVVTETPFESNTADTIQELAKQAVRRQANRPATVTINQGTVLAVYVAKDVDFAGVVARY